VLRVLALGVYINCLAQIAFTLIQAAGRSDITAKLHVAEVPLYLGTAWILISSRGIEGAAIAWTLRVAVDAGAMFIVARRIAPSSAGPEYTRAWMLITLTVVGTIAAVVLGTASVAQRAAMTVVSIVVIAAFAWFGVTSASDRRRLLSVIARTDDAPYR
jgi:O-antigen/teichoic acid export membrane protein